MTLNITLLTPQAIYQSADFRLWDPVARAVLTDTSDKTVQVSGLEWSAFVTYTGVGRFGGRDTGEWIVSWLEGQEHGSFDEMVEQLRKHGSAWLNDIASRTGARPPHAFVAVTFQESKAKAAVVSNFEVGRSMSKPSRELDVRFVLGRRPVVLVTGCASPATRRILRKALAGLAQLHWDDSMRIRTSMQRLNRWAALEEGSKCPISQECHVYSVDPSGRGSGSAAVVGAQPKLVMNGMDVAAILEKTIRELVGDNAQVVGTSFATSRPSGVATRACAAQMSALESSHDYELLDLSSTGDVTGAARSAVLGGVTVGEGATMGGPSKACAWIGQEVTFLTDLGGISGQALDIDESGNIVGWVEDSERRSRACLWDPTFGLTTLDLGQATRGGARRLASDGTIAGWASAHPTEGGQLHYKPAAWGADGQVRVLDDLRADWGEAVDATSSEVFLVWGHIGTDSLPILWRGREQQPLAEPSTRIVPIAIDDRERVLGFVTTSEGAGVAICWDSAGGWVRLGTQAGWYPSSMNNLGITVGYCQIDGYERPWLRQADGTIVFLPHYAYHHNRPARISDSGVVAGHAQADHGWHPLVWNPQDE